MNLMGESLVFDVQRRKERQWYQESNNGNFPSLNLTHKEVGGSFYTVRETVRDIIQENRVLGPAKISLQNLTSDQFFEHLPLGSIARDPQSVLDASSNENLPEPNNFMDANGKKFSVSVGYYTIAEHQGVDHEHVINASMVDVLKKESGEATVFSNGYYDGAEHVVVDKNHFINGGQVVDVTNEEFVEATILSDGHCTGVEHHIVDKEQVINGIQVDVINKESSEATNPEMQVNEPMAPIQNEQELSTITTPMAKITAATEDLIVETFSVSPVAGTTDRAEALEELRGSSDSPENDSKMLDMEKDQERSESNCIEPAKASTLPDEKFDDDLGNQMLHNIAGQDAEKSLGDTLAESAKNHEFEDITEPQVKVSHQNTITLEASNQSQMADGTKTSIQENFQAINNTNTSTEGSKPYDEEVLHKANNKHRVDGKIGDNSQRRRSTTLDRINLESWDGTAKNSAKQETNPLLAIFKAFVDAFLKFWSE